MIETALSFLLLLATAASAGDNWPQWRGPAFNGSSDSKNLPVSWSENQNIRWKTPLPSWSAATPAIWGDRILVMSGSKPGEGPQAPAHKGGGRSGSEGRAILLLCLSKANGSVLWERKLDEGNTRYSKQNMATPSPVTDGKHVWALTGTGVLTAFDMGGNVLWRRDVQKDHGPMRPDYGYASSPLLLDGRVIIQVLQKIGGQKQSYLAAYEEDTGNPAWKVNRPTDALDESMDAYSSPTMMQYSGRSELIIGGGDYITAHDPATGREIWRCGGLNPDRDPHWRVVCSPMASDGMVFISARRGPLVACKAGGQGDVTATHLAWTDPAAPDVPTPACGGKFLYVVHDNGMLTCLDPKTGKTHYVKERLPAGAYSASPVVADGKLYVMSENARTTVLAAGPEFKVLSQNQLDDGNALSSIAIAGRELFIRTAKYLYCVGESPRQGPAQ